MTAIAIRVEGLGKRYRMGLTQPDSLTELVSGLTETVKNRLTGHREENGRRGRSSLDRREFWALRDLTFDLQSGEVMGIIGRNGAGKSTLLKLISRVTSPTTGTIDLWGRVSSLLEVGTGFHPDLTGRENIFMNATLLGMTRRAVTRKLDEIVEFAGVDEFLDTQIKRYSSGMRVRLGFAVAAHLDPEILIIDEVLAVGDAEFQKKCLGKMHNVAEQGRTVLFVSHNLGAVRSLCTSAMLLDQGRMQMIGQTRDVVAKYVAMHCDRVGNTRRWPEDESIDVGDQPFLRPIEFYAEGSNGQRSGTFATDEPIALRFRFTAFRDVSRGRIGVLVRNASDVTLFGSNVSLASLDEIHVNATVEVSCEIPAQLLNRGSYFVDLGVDRPPDAIGSFLDQESIQFDVVDTQGHGVAAEMLPGVVRPPLTWSSALIHSQKS